MIQGPGSARREARGDLAGDDGVMEVCPGDLPPATMDSKSVSLPVSLCIAASLFSIENPNAGGH